MSNPTSNQCPYCGRENGEHNEMCVYADNVRVRAERDDALEILAMALPGPRPWPTESIPSKLRIYREMVLDKRRSSAVETTPNPLLKPAERLFNALCFGLTDWMHQNEGVVGPFRDELTRQLMARSPVETSEKSIHDEECANCGIGWSKHLTNKLICPDAAIADVYRFRQGLTQNGSAPFSTQQEKK